MDRLRSGRGKAGRAGEESYTSHQLQLLRMANYLIQTGDSRVLDALDLLMNALVGPGARRELEGKARGESGFIPRSRFHRSLNRAANQ